MATNDSRVTIHMAASLDGFIARKDGLRPTGWKRRMSSPVARRSTPRPSKRSLKTIDCYVMGSRTYELALDFEARGFGWSYGDKPTFVLTAPRPAAQA